MAKKQHAEEHENHERWLVSWADFMTLLFALFVVMYASSSVDQKKMDQTVKSVRWAMHMQGLGGGGPQASALLNANANAGVGLVENGAQYVPVGRKVKQVEAVRRRLEKSLYTFLNPTNGQARVTLETEGQKIMVRLSAGQFFDPAESALRPEVFPVLDTIAEELLPLKKPIRVEGHTDDRPMGSSRFRDNWELSSSRAASVVRYMEQVHHAPADVLSVAGYAATRPVTSNDTPAGRERNRRIDIVVELEPGGSITGL